MVNDYNRSPQEVLEVPKEALELRCPRRRIRRL